MTGAPWVLGTLADSGVRALTGRTFADSLRHGHPPHAVRPGGTESGAAP